MKKLGSLFLGIFLIGCETPHSNDLNIPKDMAGFHDVGRTPWPWVKVIPSERALAYQGFTFPDVRRHLLYALSDSYTLGKFKKVRLALIDYSLLPASPNTTQTLKQKVDNQTYYAEYTALPQRYFMSIQLYECDQRPPAKPSFKGTAYISSEIAAPMEAMHILLREITDNMIVYPDKEIDVSLD